MCSMEGGCQGSSFRPDYIIVPRTGKKGPGAPIDRICRTDGVESGIHLLLGARRSAPRMYGEHARMIRRIRSAAVVGVEGRPIEIEVDVSRRGLPAVVVVGLPDAVVREARDRVKSAILNSGHEFPNAKVIISLAPAALRKEGSTYDLPIALGILAAAAGGVFPARALERYCIIGELALDGRVRAVRGALPMALALARRRGGPRKMLLPAGNALEVRDVDGITPVPVQSLAETVAVLSGARPEPPVPSRPVGVGRGPPYWAEFATLSMRAAKVGSASTMRASCPTLMLGFDAALTMEARACGGAGR